MGLWQGRLQNGPIDIVIDTVLCIALAGSHLPQVFRMYNKKSTKGISHYFLLLNALYSNIQFAQGLALHARAYPTNDNGIGGTVIGMIATGKLTGFEAYGALLGLIQVGIQWLSTIIICLFYSRYSSSQAVPLAKMVLAHAAIFLLPAAYFCIMRPLREDLASGLLMGFNNRFSSYIALGCVLAEIYPQVTVMRRMAGAQRAFSPITFSMRSVILVLVALRWLSRFGSPDWSQMEQLAGSDPFCLRIWHGAVLFYDWGFVPFNYMIDALGTILLVVLYHMRHVQGTGEYDNVAGHEIAKVPL